MRMHYLATYVATSTKLYYIDAYITNTLHRYVVNNINIIIVMVI